MSGIKQLMHALPLNLSFNFFKCNQGPSLVVPGTSHKEEPELLRENLHTGQEERIYQQEFTPFFLTLPKILFNNYILKTACKYS